MQDLDLEREYSPSAFTKRFQDTQIPQEEVLKHFVQVSEEATKLGRELYKSRLDVRYGGTDDNQLLDIYYKDQEQGTPIFVYIHGGYWQLLDKSSSGPILHSLVQHNYRVLLVDYNLCPQVTLSQLTQQISVFYKWLFEYAETTAAPSISICGHSAGAHLAMQMLDKEIIQSPSTRLNIQHMFLISGVYDLRDLWPLQCCNHKNVLSLNLNSATELSPMVWVKNSITLADHYRKLGTRFHLMVGGDESATFKQQSHGFAQVLENMKFQVNYRIFENYDHFNIIEDLQNPQAVISKYIIAQLGHDC